MAQQTDTLPNGGPLKKRPSEHAGAHRISHIQNLPAHVEPAPQDAVFIQGQLLRSITTALAAVGFDSATPSALEVFRAETEEYMLHFLTAVRESMTSGRRTSAVPQDFSVALALSQLAPSDFNSHLDLDIPPELSCPSIAAPLPDEAAPPNLAPMLGAELVVPDNSAHPYIPAHFPALPSKHAWMNTPTFTAREHDPRKIRERATQEGILAESALRRLTTAKKAQSIRKGNTSQAEKNRDQLWKDALADILGDSMPEVRKDGDGDIIFDGLDKVDQKDEASTSKDLLLSGNSMLVNHDQSHWRRDAGLGGIRT